MVDSCHGGASKQEHKHTVDTHTHLSSANHKLRLERSVHGVGSTATPHWARTCLSTMHG